MSKLLKKRMADELTNEVESLESFLLYDYTGLKAEDVHSLRSACFEKEVKAKVVKNTMAKLALSSDSYPEEVKALFKGPTAMAYGGDSIASVAKLLVEFRKENKKLVIKGGYIPGKVLNADDVEALSKVPSREELLSMLAGVFQAPMQQIASILAGPPRNISNILSNLTSKMEENNIESVGDAAS
ncbi:50S ribosomal protein L10 [Candidatus Uabimicrobium amorphum]|uniref:Large ribosomal subunit protein uL10 n=1 Tax=Uabimicrobium amorphum TaxID=2596890 RepID=A0A5S9F5S4_UABAM|nr:50S ribosomal protein L10 [Candidatus Uabimicrobium amorphum]BBM85572.1 50S ribosomal protein L10 [Candidatus Uabimicrobium amorphum]